MDIMKETGTGIIGCLKDFIKSFSNSGNAELSEKEAELLRNVKQAENKDGNKDGNKINTMNVKVKTKNPKTETKEKTEKKKPEDYVI